MTISSLVPFSLAILLATSPTLSLAEKKNEKVVATVNGESITQTELDETFRQNKLFLSTEKVTKKKVLQDLINRRIGIQMAIKNKLDQDEVVKYKMQDIMYHAQVSKDLEPKLKTITVNDNEVKKYYEENKEYRTAHILFRVMAEADKAQVQAAFNQAMDVYNQVMKKPESFGELANKYTQSTTAPQGGDLGFQPPPRLAPEYFEAIKGKSIGHITKPIRTQFGFHVIKVLGIKDFKDIDVNLYKKIIYDQKRDKLVEDYFTDLRKKATIKVMAKELN